MRYKAFFCALLLVGLSLTALAQTSRGTVSGTINDPTNAVISGASVTLTSTATTITRSTVTNGDGLYRFDAVDLGTYTVKFASSGFGSITKSNVAVSANLTSTVDAQLTPGGQELSVDVTSESGALLQTDRAFRAS